MRLPTPVSTGVRTAGLSLLLLGQVAGGQTIAPAPVAAEPAVAAEPTIIAPQVAPGLRLERDTLVNLMVLTEVNSRESLPGHRFKLRVHQPVIVGGRTLIPEGALAWGEVASAQRTGAIGQAGELGVRLLYVDVDGVRIPLSGQRASTGRDAADKVILSVLGFGILGLLAKGNNAKFKAGDLVEGHVAETMIFAVGQPPVTAAPPVTTAPTVTTPPTIAAPFVIVPAEAPPTPR